MLNNKELNTVRWHAEVPVCGIKSGIKTHLSLLPVSDIILLCRFFACSVNELAEQFYGFVQKPRRERNKVFAHYVDNFDADIKWMGIDVAAGKDKSICLPVNR